MTTRRRYIRRFSLIAGLMALVLSACASPTAAPQAPAPQSAASATTPVIRSSPTPSPMSSATPTETAPTAVPPTPASEPVTATVQLAPIQPLQNETIIDRPFRNMRALTDGSVKYRLALWGPGSEWIAAVPQDGPGMDVINSVTGEVRAVVTDTFVLEPVWDVAAQPGPERDTPNECLLVHRIVAERDQLDVFCIPGFRYVRPPITSDQPIHTPRLDGNYIIFSQNEQVMWQSLVDTDRPPESVVPDRALYIAVTDQGNAFNDALMAWNPVVANLDDVQTFVAAVDRRNDAPYALSSPGEGLWLPRWSPDHSKLALTSIAGRVVTTQRNGAARYDLGPGDLPSWAPDSERIAYAGANAGRESTTRDIFVVDWQGNGPRTRLTDANTEQFYTSPSWSSDGARLAFVELDSGQVFVGNVP